jgi:hypothetical protein
MLQGLYKVEMQTVHGSRRGVIYAYDGKMMGGNSAFAFIGTYRESGDGQVVVDISTMRHNEDPNFQPLFKFDKITLALRGKQRGEQYHFEGGTTQLPGVAFNSVMTPLSEEAAPPVPSGEKGGIRNGLYSIHIRMLDGLDGGNTGVMVLHDGKIRGGDAFFAYIGSYSSANGRWKGEIISTTSIRRTMASGRYSAATKSVSAFPAPTPTTARSAKPPRLPTSAAFASARC